MADDMLGKDQGATQSRADEERLRRERDTAQRYLDIAGVIIVALDQRGEVTLINRKGRDILGYSEEEIMGSNWFQRFLPKPMRESVSGVFQQLMAGRAELPAYFENPVLTRSGDERLIAWHNTVLRDPDGNITGTLSSGEDITDRRRAEDALQWELELNRALAQLSVELTSPSAEVEEITNTILGHARALTGSEHGCVAVIDSQSGDSVAHTLTRMMDACPVPTEQKKIVFPRGKDGRYRGLWGHALNTREAFYTNSAESHDSAAGVPEGHIPLRNFLTAPAVIAGEPVGQIAVANRASDYTPKELAAVKQLADRLALAIDRMRRKAALQKSQALLNETQAITRVGGWEYDVATGHITWTDEVYRIYGVSRDYDPNDVARDMSFYAPECTPTLRQAFERAVRNAEPYDLELEFIRATGERIWVRTIGKPVLEDGRVVRLTGNFMDITDRKRTEGDLETSRAFLEKVMQLSPFAMWIADETGTVIRTNRSLREALGLTDDEIVGKYNVLEDGNLAEQGVMPQVRAVFEDLEPARFSIAWAGRKVDETDTHGTRDLVIDVSVFPITNSEGKLANVVCQWVDISERRRVEEERQKLESQLRQSQKMEAIGQLAGGVAHDFNNILTAILGNVELAVGRLQADVPADRRLLDHILQIEQSAGRAVSLTRQLLAFSRRQVFQPTILNLNQTLAEMEKMLRRLITENIELKMDLAPDLHSVRADAGQIEQVVMNLVVNARDAMVRGGMLTVATTNMTADDTYANTHADASPGPHVVLVVSDTGCGMDTATAERVFEPFFTTKALGYGTGLGLATVYGIVRQAEGHITVYSEPGRGTTFRICLPAVEAPAKRERERRDETALPTGTETILVCEDDASVRGLAEQILRGAGYTVLAAENGARALERATDPHRSIDLLVTDVIMPDLDGKRLAQTLGHSHPELRTLFVSGYTADIIAHHGVLDEGVEFLEKPFSRRSLLRRVREVLDRRERDSGAP